MRSPSGQAKEIARRLARRGDSYYRIPENVEAWQYSLKNMAQLPVWIEPEWVLQGERLAVPGLWGQVTMQSGDWLVRSEDGTVRAHSDRDFVVYFRKFKETPRHPPLRTALEAFFITCLVFTIVGSIISIVDILDTAKQLSPFVASVLVFKNIFFFGLTYAYVSRVYERHFGEQEPQVYGTRKTTH